MSVVTAARQRTLWVGETRDGRKKIERERRERESNDNET